MTEVLIAPVVPRDVETCAEGGNATPGMARWLGLAAAPTFAIMAMWNGLFSGQPDMLCMAMQGSSPMSGMTVMYLLMSAFHTAPWLRLISSRRAMSTRHVFEHVVTSDEVIEQRSSLLHCMSPLLAQSGHHGRADPCPLSGERTSRGRHSNVRFC
jgi:hypothetical protein